MTLRYYCYDREVEGRIERPSSHLTDSTMASHQESIDSAQDIEEVSLRSRASSVVATGTKFSISTLLTEDLPSVNEVFTRSEHPAALRPRSMFSIASYETTLPPYESPSAAETSGQLSDHRVEATTGEASKAVEQRPTSPTSPVSPASPVVDAENALSVHYGRVVRTIDQNHVNRMNRLKEAHQEELGATRHAIDQAYRKELKANNHEVEKMREEMASLSATHDATTARLQREAVEQATEQAQAHEIAIVKACNAIEDVWEARWNDRIRLADEEASKSESLHQLRLQEIMALRDRAIEDKDVAVIERDRAWIRTLDAIHPELREELEDFTQLRIS